MTNDAEHEAQTGKLSDERGNPTEPSPPGAVALEIATRIAHSWFQKAPGRKVAPAKAAGELWIDYARAIEAAEARGFAAGVEATIEYFNTHAGTYTTNSEMHRYLRALNSAPQEKPSD